MANSPQSVLARKLSAGQDSAGNVARSVPRALRLSLARSADELLNLPLSVIAIRQSASTAENLSTMIEDGWLLLLFSSADTSAAAVCLDASLVSAFVQKQTIGEVLCGGASDRAFTDTDAAMVVPLLEDLVRRARDMVEASADQSCLSQFEFRSRAEDARSMVLGMTDQGYRVFDMTVELENGRCQGHIRVILPDFPELEDEPTGTDCTDGGTLSQAAGVLRADLRAVISQLSLPLKDLSALTVGQVLPLAHARVSQTTIETIDQTKVAIGRLGQSGGMRAVRINEQLDVTGAPEALESAFLAGHSDNSPSLASDPQIVRGSIVGLEVKEPEVSGSLSEPNEMLLGTSEEMVAEISQLAGLPQRIDDPNPKG